jgi:DMSO reductase anchor subunit
MRGELTKFTCLVVIDHLVALIGKALNRLLHLVCSIVDQSVQEDSHSLEFVLESKEMRAILFAVRLDLVINNVDSNAILSMNSLYLTTHHEFNVDHPVLNFKRISVSNEPSSSSYFWC